ncbi:MAG: hypothetical protein ACFB3T_01240 [Geminicoccaceae bacterium]
MRRIADTSNLILAPATILGAVLNLPALLQQAAAAPLLSLAVLAVIVIAFIRSLGWRGLRLPQRTLGRVLRYGAFGLSAAGLAVLGFLLISSATSGIHFVVVASAPDRASAQAEARQINQADSNLHATFYGSSGDNPYYSIVIGNRWFGGALFSRQAAEQTLAQARGELGRWVHPSAYIRSYDIGAWLAVHIGKVTGNG